MDRPGPTAAQRDILRRYAAGQAGTRETIERLGFDDYADLLIAMAQNDLDMPRPAGTPARRANIALATEIPQPLLRHGR